MLNDKMKVCLRSYCENFLAFDSAMCKVFERAKECGKPEIIKDVAGEQLHLIERLFHVYSLAYQCESQEDFAYFAREAVFHKSTADEIATGIQGIVEDALGNAYLSKSDWYYEVDANERVATMPKEKLLHSTLDLVIIAGGMEAISNKSNMLVIHEFITKSRETLTQTETISRLKAEHGRVIAEVKKVRKKRVHLA